MMKLDRSKDSFLSEQGIGSSFNASETGHMVLVTLI